MTDASHAGHTIAESPLTTFQSHLRDGRLAYQFDSRTGKAVFHPRVVGPASGNPDLEWRISHGQGTVYATTSVHASGEAPYNVSLVDLDEGFRMMTRVQVPDGADVYIGMRVSMKPFDPGPGAAPYPIFEVMS